MSVHTLMLAVVIVIPLSWVHGQTQETTSSRSPDTRTLSVYTGIGFLELAVVGVQYQINDKFAVGLKATTIILGGPAFIFPPAGTGGGIKFSYYIDRTGANNFLWANAINVELSYLDPGITKDPGRAYHAIGLEITAGRDAIKNGGLGVLWAAGGAFSASTGEPPLVFPALKLGLHLDF